MKQVTIQNTELKISPVGMGCVNAGLKWDHGDADRIFDAFYDMGGNLYDTARCYSDWIPPEVGRSERVLGDWVSGCGKRNNIVIVTKGGHPDMTQQNPDMHNSRATAENMRKDLELSLRALRTDYIDIYFYHRDNTGLPAAELIEIMEGFVREGKIRYYGASNWSPARMKEADEYCAEMGYRGFSANQMLFNIGQEHMLPPADDTLAVMDENMKDYHMKNPACLAMPYMSVCSGFFHKLKKLGPDGVRNMEYFTPENLKLAEKLEKLTEKYNATLTQVLLGFFATRPFACLPLYGPRGEAYLKEAMDTFDISFRKEDF